MFGRLEQSRKNYRLTFIQTTFAPNQDDCIVTFEKLNLSKPFLNALVDLDYMDPTPIQEKVFPIIMSGQNMMGIAQTGTGKTFAYLLPLLRQLPFSEQREPRILILAPTRVLAVQIHNEIVKLAKYTELRSAVVHGDTNINTQKQLVYNGLDVLVATPGRLIDLAFTGVLRLKKIQKLVIDEVDEMLSLGLKAQLTNALELLPSKRQTLLFSATFTSDVEAFIANYLPNIEKVEVNPHGTPIEKIDQRVYHVPNFFTKVNLLGFLLSNDVEMSKVLVFVGTKKMADLLFEHLTKLFPEQIGVIHSNKAHNTRLSTLKLFQEGTYRVLIATDIIARGMDIIDVTHVVNFEVPDVAGDYIHRIGRTGRADKDGVAISFATEKELQYLDEIETLMKREVSLEPLPQKLIISSELTDEEKMSGKRDKDYLKDVKEKSARGAFHEKKAKNMKENQGGPKNKRKRIEKLKKSKISKKPNKTRF